MDSNGLEDNLSQVQALGLGQGDGEDRYTPPGPALSRSDDNSMLRQNILVRAGSPCLDPPPPRAPVAVVTAYCDDEVNDV